MTRFKLMPAAIAFLALSPIAWAEQATPSLPVGTRLAYEISEANSVSDRIELQVIGAHGPWTIYLGDPGGHEFYYAETTFGIFSTDCLHPEMPTPDRIASARASISALGAYDSLEFTIEGTTQQVQVSPVFAFTPEGEDATATLARTITVIHSEYDTPIIYTADADTGIVYQAQWTEGYFDKLVELDVQTLPDVDVYSQADLMAACAPVFAAP